MKRRDGEDKARAAPAQHERPLRSQAEPLLQQAPDRPLQLASLSNYATACRSNGRLVLSIIEVRVPSSKIAEPNAASHHAKLGHAKYGSTSAGPTGPNARQLDPR
jgi:hypothetical protein